MRVVRFDTMLIGDTVDALAGRGVVPQQQIGFATPVPEL